MPDTVDPRYKRLLDNNRAWADARMREDPGYFDRLAAGQQPPFLFIGCCDSRKPLDTLTQSEPGELFIHRNIANQVLLGDENVMSVMDFAVDVLRVDHVVICGHTACGGVTAAITGEAPDRVGDWVAPVREVYMAHRAELDRIQDLAARADALAELNVVQQVQNACRTRVMQRAFARGDAPRVHGWLFEIRTGRIRELDLPLEAWRAEGLLPEGAWRS